MRFGYVEEDGDEALVPFEDVRCWHKITCAGAKLVKKRHDNNDSLHWRCPVCGGYYGAVHASSESGGRIPPNNNQGEKHGR